MTVILDWPSLFTTLIILVGWAVKTAVASLVSEWATMGGDDRKNWEAWLAYSIP